MSTADLEGLPEAVTGATGPLTIRMVMQGKEVGSIIGKKGDNVKKYREESGAKINISDASCPERIVTVSGSSEGIYKAFTMICKKFEEDINAQHGQSALPKPPVTIRLVVPASQCGSLIGKAGAKIKEIRDATGASIQVASEMLPNSTERAVTISGSADQITQCIFHICAVMLESPPKGATIPYRPKPILPPGLMAVAAGGAPAASFLPAPSPTVFFPPSPDAAHLHKLALQPQTMLPPGAFPFIGQSLLPGAATSTTGLPTGSVSIRPNAPIQNGAAQTHEMTIPNDLIGCIIGRGGAKINEIRQLSGAQIKIANADESLGDRKVTITGTPDTVQAAQYLINASVELHAVAQGIQHQISTNYPTPTEAVSSANEVTTTTSNTQAFTGLPVINPQQFMASAGLRLPVIGLPVSATPFDPSSAAAKLTGKVKPTVAAASKFTPY